MERFYRENFLFRVPVTFSESDFFQVGVGDAPIKNPFAKVVPLFGLSRYGGTDQFILPNEPAYQSQIQVVLNSHFIGGVPMYEAPQPDPNEPVGTLRARLKHRLQGAFRRKS